MIIDPIRARPQVRRGFTLPEAVMALVLLGIAAAGVLFPFAGGAAAQVEGWHRTLGAKLANDLLERIIVDTPFVEIVGRWNDYTEVQGQVKDANDTVFTDPMYANFSRDVTCKNVYVPQETAFAAPDYIFVTVRVQYQRRVVARIDRLVSG